MIPVNAAATKIGQRYLDATPPSSKQRSRLTVRRPKLLQNFRRERANKDAGELSLVEPAGELSVVEPTGELELTCPEMEEPLPQRGIFGCLGRS